MAWIGTPKIFLSVDKMSRKNGNAIRFIDLFCGIGGFRIAVEQLAGDFGVLVKCVFSSDIDKECQKAYEKNFGEKPAGDITAIKAEDIPDHDILLAGFPCCQWESKSVPPIPLAVVI